VTDPLAELVGYLRRGEAPPLAWVLRHAPDGSLQAAWDACQEPMAMLYLAPGIQHAVLSPRDADLFEAHDRTVAEALYAMAQGLFDAARGDMGRAAQSFAMSAARTATLPALAAFCKTRGPGVCRAVRALQPTPPTLPALLAAARRGESA
jgi:hypothetical protein